LFREKIVYLLIKIIIQDTKIFFTVIRVDLRILDENKNQKYLKL
jgi:hypothetical protein